jgi:flavin-dependent dehydrogenase
VSADFAAVVVGGGPAGAAAALTLARRGHRTLLVDNSKEDFKIGESLAPAARPLLRDLGILDHFVADGHLPSPGNVSAWGSPDASATDFVFNPHGNGWHLDRVRFDRTLRDEACDCGAKVLSNSRLTSAERDGDDWRLVLQTDSPFQSETRASCNWLLDATGRRATVARLMGAKRIHDDRLVAFYGTFRLSSTGSGDQDCRTAVESAPDGWWYSALLPSSNRVVAFLTDNDLADTATLQSPAGFAKLVTGTRHISHFLDSYECRADISPRTADARSSRLDRFGGPGWLSAGDAAMAFDPLSSQGILNALYTGMKAGEAIARALSDDDSHVGEYLRQLDSIYEAYRLNKTAFYAAEGRWCEQPFWQRRVA